MTSRVRALVLTTVFVLTMACYLPSVAVETTPTALAPATETSPVERNSTVGASNTPTPQKSATVTALRSLYVRLAAGYGSPVRGILWHGQSVALIGECNEIGWIRIKSGTLQGWVNARYLSGGCEQ